jgi:hypothetical protein
MVRRSLTMKQKELLRLQADLALMDKATEHLRYSYQRCQTVGHKENYTADELEHFESLTGRFARLSDLIIQKIFRLIAQLDLDNQGTIRDQINRAEKKGLIASAETFIEIRELRNNIDHEYDPTATFTLFHTVITHCPPLFNAVEKIHQYCEKYTVTLS